MKGIDCRLLVFIRRWLRMLPLWLVGFQRLWLVHFDPPLFWCAVLHGEADARLFHPLHYGDKERLQTRFPWHRSFKRTGRPPHHRRTQEAYAHRLVFSVWFPSPEISKMRYYIVKCLYERAERLLSQRENCTCLLFLSLMITLFLPCRKSPRPENRVPVLSPRPSTSLLRFYPMSKPIRKTFPLPTTTKHTSRFQVRDYIKIIPSAKDAVDQVEQDGVVYRIPWECGKVYIGETGRPMQDRIK